MNSPVSTNSESNKSSRLTQDDVKQLLSEPAAESRIAVVKKLAEDRSSGTFRPNEILIAEQIFRLLLRDTEVRVRAALSESLKDDTSIPTDIVKTLAADEESVARPVLESSPVLGDEDLIEIIKQNAEITKHIAIANRQNVSSSVSSALVETENSEVVTHLVRNSKAEISDQSFQKIMDDFPENVDVVGELVKRASLPVAVVENLLNIVSASVAHELKEKYKTSSRKLEEETQKTRESMTLKLLETTVDPDEVQDLVNQLYDTKRLSPSIILTALCRGNFAFFEVSLAKMAGIPVANVRKLVSDKGDLGFRSLYKKAQLPESMFDASRLVLDVMREISEKNEARPGTIHHANRAVEKLFIRTGGREIENLAYIIALIRQNTH